LVVENAIPNEKSTLQFENLAVKTEQLKREKETMKIETINSRLLKTPSNTDVAGLITTSFSSYASLLCTSNSACLVTKTSPATFN
jgi:hypothetical protein